MSWCWRKYVMLLILASLIITRAGYVESCIEEERNALLDLNPYFKSHLEYEYVQYFVGIGEGEKDKYNCCTWKRVKCNTTTQHVVELDLSALRIFWGNPWVFNVTMLKPFRQLTSLDISFNGIRGLVEKEGLCVLKNLSVLKLADNDFSASPSCLQNMTSLLILDLSDNKFNGRFQDIIPSTFASLSYLDLSNNNLKGKLLPNIFRNLTSLEHLDLSVNNFEGKLSFSSFANMDKLHFLDLSQNHLQVQTENSSRCPSFQLQHLGLQGCSLNQPKGIIPKFLSQQYNLSFLDLSDNHLFGPFPFSISNDSIHGDFGLENDNWNASASYFRHSLKRLAISGNNFHGELPQNIGLIFPQIMFLNVSRCHFEGPIPASIAHMSQLGELDLSFNNFSGELPRQLLSNITRLTILMLNDNQLVGEIIPNYMNLPGLEILKLRNNHFGGTIKDSLRISSSLAYLDISNNKVAGSIPPWIGQMSSLGMLSISKNAMEGQIPTGICKLQALTYLDLSENNFNGSIPSCSVLTSLNVMLLRHNKFTGDIPKALSSASELITLDLRDNQLSGGIPLWINKLQSLQILLLAGNKFEGQIPHELCELRYLNLLDLSRNQLFGRILTCLGSISFGSQPTYNAHSNTEFFGFTHEHIFFYHTIGVDEIDNLLVKTMNLSYVGFDLSHMSILDLSNNGFSGIIPPELGNLQHVHSINLSHNCLSGTIPANLSNLKNIEGLDLSYNNLSGVIPYQLAQLYSLATFNVSYNNLTGRTPDAEQFQTFNEKSYFGNPGLCVTHVNKSCNTISNNDTPPPTSTTTKEDGGEGLDMEEFLWVFGATSIITFIATILVLSINRQWREAFFDFVEFHLLWWLL